MLVVRTISLLPIAAALLAGFLAASTLRVGKRENRVVTFFFLLNVATMLWAFFYAIELNLDPKLVLDLAPVGSLEWIAYTLQILGLAAAPTYWFLFAAANARKSAWIRGWRLALAHIPFLYTFIVAVTNPLHRLFVAQDAPGGPISYGPLAPPSQVGIFLLVGWGTWLLVTTIWRSGTGADRRQAMAFAGAATLPFLGGLAWALRHTLSLPLDVHPAPLLFTLLNAVLLYQVLQKGLADIVPVAAQQALRTMTDAVLMVDAAGTLLLLNPAAERLFPGAAPGARLAAAVPKVESAMRGLLGRGAEYGEFEVTIDEAVYWGRVRQTLDRRGSAVAKLILLSDVTELREIQAELVTLNEELRDKVRALDEARAHAEARGEQLNATVDQLREATEAKSRFLASMSHELRTPLNSIIGFSGVLLQRAAGPINDEQEKQLSMIQSSGKRLLGLIGDILDLSRIEAGKESVEFERVDVATIIEHVAVNARSLCAEKNLAFSVKSVADPIVIETDPGRAEQILLNLITNAVKFTDWGGITVEMRPFDDSVEIRVVDTGVGIPADALERIFSEFEQVENIDGPARPGAGLGLAISRKLAVLLGGKLGVESTVGRGSTFTLTLPRH